MSDFVVTVSVLDGLVANARLMLSDLANDEFQQLCGVFSPRPGYGRQNSIAFTSEACTGCYRRLVSECVLCAQVIITMDGGTNYSLILANTHRGVERGIAAAKKVAHKARARIQIIRPEGQLLQ